MLVWTQSSAPFRKKCIKSWKKHCRDYKIIEWNEDNFDLSAMPIYVRQAYEAKKWAFVTDYVRLKIVYDYGGIYLDTDVEVIRNLDDLLEYEAFFGFEAENYINTGLGFGAVSGAAILTELMEAYRDIAFVKADGSLDLTSCPVRNMPVFLRNGLRPENTNQLLGGNTMFFASEYFCPKSFATGMTSVTSNTYSIHQFDASWYTDTQQQAKNARWKKSRQKARKAWIKKRLAVPSRILLCVLGERRYVALKQWLWKG